MTLDYIDDNDLTLRLNALFKVSPHAFLYVCCRFTFLYTCVLVAKRKKRNRVLLTNPQLSWQHASSCNRMGLSRSGAEFESHRVLMHVLNVSLIPEWFRSTTCAFVCYNVCQARFSLLMAPDVSCLCRCLTLRGLASSASMRSAMNSRSWCEP